MTRNNRTLHDHRDQILNRLEARLRQDERVLAAWLSGSAGRGSDDDWSEIDLHVAVRDDDYATWLTERSALYCEVGTPVLIQTELASETRVYQLVLFEGPVFVDLVVHPLLHAVLDVDEQLIFDRVGLPTAVPGVLDEEVRLSQIQHNLEFFWLMTPIALKYIARANTHRAVTQFELITGAYINVWRLLFRPERRESGGSHWLHPELDAELVANLPRLGSTIDQVSVFDVLTRIMSDMRQLESALGAVGVVIPAEAMSDIESFRHVIGVLIRSAKVDA